MILYHASRSHIDEFYVNPEGLHLGSLNSALEAALRHSSLGEDGKPIYVHKVKVKKEMFGKVYESNDVGYDWYPIILDAATYGYTCIRYVNKYEPSIKPSFCIWNKGMVESIIEIDTYSEDKARKYLEEDEWS